MYGLWQRLPFVGRLLVTASIALLIAGTLMVSISARQESSYSRQELRMLLNQELETLPAALSEIVVIGDYASLQQTLDRYVLRPLIILVRYQDTHGTTIISEKNITINTPPEWFLKFFRYNSLSGESTINVGGHEYGKLTLIISPKERAYYAWIHLIEHIGILWLAIAIDFIGIWLILRSGLKPLTQFEQAIEAIAAGNLNTYIEPSGSPEFLRVIKHFNQMAKAIHDADESLRYSEQQFRAIIETSPVPFALYDESCKFIHLNTAFINIFGYTLTDIPTLDDWERQAYPDQVYRLWVKNLRHDRLDAEMNDKIEPVELNIRCKNNFVRTVMVIIRPLLSSPKRYRGLVTFYDITDIKQAQELSERTARLKSEFLANINHELRTPMNAMIGFAELALSQPVTPTVRDYLEKIKTASKSLLGILNDIIDYAKIIAGRMIIEKHAFNLNKLLNDLHQLITDQAQKKSLRFIIDIDSKTPRQLIGDARCLQQVLTNLLNNAIKFTEIGTVSLLITARQHDDATYFLKFQIVDTGIGMSAETVANLFNAFTQGDGSNSRRFGGTGLGLAISRDLLLLMGSDLTVESTLGKGSSFSFELSMAVADDQHLTTDKNLQLTFATQIANQELTSLLSQQSEIHETVNPEILNAIAEQIEALMIEMDLIPDELIEKFENALPANRSALYKIFKNHVDQFDYKQARNVLNQLMLN